MGPFTGKTMGQPPKKAARSKKHEPDRPPKRSERTEIAADYNKAPFSHNRAFSIAGGTERKGIGKED
jgi:hypothetical protein